MNEVESRFAHDGTGSSALVRKRNPVDDPIQYWNEEAGPKWVALHTQLDRLMDPLGRKVMELAQLRPGEHVLDVGCGCGSTSLQLLPRVKPSGSVTGLDVSAPMLEHARSQTSSLKEGPQWVLADAATYQFPTPFDVIYSRLGVMFFAQPAAAFSHLHKQLRKGGRMAFICWQPLPLNPLFCLGLEAASPFVTLPEPSSPEVPGPFSLSPAGKAERLLHQAGFEDIEVTSWESHIGLGETEETAEFLLKMGPVAALVKEQEPATVDRIRNHLCQKLKQLPTDEQGCVQLATATWLVKARS